MTKDEKFQLVQDLAQRITESGQSFYVTDIGGMSANEVNNLRKMCYEMDVHLQVVKNKLVRKALEELNIENEQFDTLFQGPTSLMIASNKKAPAELIKKFRKKSDKPVFKGAYIEEATFVGDDKLDQVLELKSKEEILGEIVTLLQSPATNVISALTAPASNLAGILAQEGGGKLAGLIKAIQEKNAA